VVETLNVVLAPSGRPLAAFANGTIAFTSKVSGVPDILVTLTSPSGKHNLGNIMELPVFHPCVRLARWKERPGELSFIPPDGRFILAGYEVDLLPSMDGKSGSSVKLPVNLEIRTSLGPSGSDFEVKLQITRISGAPGSSSGFGRGSGLGGGGSGPGVGRALGGPLTGTPASPSLQDVSVRVPLPATVRNLTEIRPSKGDVTYSPGDGAIEWHIATKEMASGSSYFSLRCTVVGMMDEDGAEDELDPTGFGFGASTKEYSYHEPYQNANSSVGRSKAGAAGAGDEKDEKKVSQNKILMPTSAAISFAVRGWLPSGIKVESIVLDARKSRGLGESVKPYKGVKYLAVSKGGVEIRC
jgi:AP-3 complex subunit mu